MTQPFRVLAVLTEVLQLLGSPQLLLLQLQGFQCLLLASVGTACVCVCVCLSTAGLVSASSGWSGLRVFAVSLI